MATACTLYIWVQALTGATYEPVVLTTEQATTQEPYIYNGSIRSSVDSGVYRGSGYAVLPHTVLTAAHLVFDEENLTWENSCIWYWKYHNNSKPPLGGDNGQLMTSEVWTSYASRVEDDPSPPGYSTLETFNADTAALYSTSLVAGETNGGSMKMSDAFTNPYLTGNRQKMLVGYPLDENYIPEFNQYKMHRTPPGNYSFSKDPNSSTDDYGWPWRLYRTYSADSYGGNSGGPLYVLFEDGNWYPVATFVGGNNSLVVRSIDSDVASLVDMAERHAGGTGWVGASIILVQPEHLTVIRGNNAVFTVTAAGDPPLEYQWRKNGVNISGANTDTLILENVNGNSEGAYSVKINNSLGSITSIEAILTVVEPPQIAINPSSISVTVNYRESTTRTLSISNLSEGPLKWKAGFYDENDTLTSNDLESLLERLDEKHDQITALIPDLFDFSDGITGTEIFDGWKDMYDGGNRLLTNFNTKIEYSDGNVTDSSLLGPSGRYFTRKYPGLFLFAANLDKIDYFEVKGDLGADGAGFTDGTVIKTTKNGVPLKGFVNRMYGVRTPFNPSVNHLIIVPDLDEIDHQYPITTYNEEHRVFNLENANQLIYMLYAGSNGRYIDNEQTEDILNAALEIINPVIPWVSINPVNGVTAQGESDELTLTFNSSEIPAGTHTATLILESNDPNRPAVEIPLVLNVLNPDPPEISVAPGSLDFGEMVADEIRQSVFTITNTGEVFLRITDTSTGLPDFIVEEFEEIVIDSGRSKTLTVTYAPTTQGSVSDTLTLFSNDPDTPEYEITLTAFGYIPDSSFSLPNIELNLRQGETTSSTFQLNNSGNGPLDWILMGRSSGELSIDSPLEECLQGLNENYGIITSSIPNIWDLREGKTGVRIYNGGGNMLEEGNMISTNLTNRLSYFDNAVTDRIGFGPNGRYFTLKVPGLWVLAADLDGIDRVTTYGGLGTNGSGTADGSVIKARVNGITYKGFVKRVYGTSKPSVNHIFIIPDDPDATQFFLNNTNADDHRIHNLGNVKRLYYLLFGGANGERYDDETMLKIMKRFLYSLRPGTPPWMTVETVDGTLDPAGSQSLTVHFDTQGLSPGTYNTQLVLNSNDPDKSSTGLPITINLLPPLPAEVSVSPSSFTLDLQEGEQVQQNLTINNTGSGYLDWVVTSADSTTETTPPLEDILLRLNNAFTSITDEIPNRFEFTGGVSSATIHDGGGDMYSQGNAIVPNNGQNVLYYSDNTIVQHVLLGENGRYFTRKYPGLFVFGADLDGLNTIGISGNLRSDGDGYVDGSVINLFRGRSHYKGFFKRVYEVAGRPSVNHIFIVKDNGIVDHVFPDNTGKDDHDIINLSGITRIYYLLFSGDDGYYYDDEAGERIMHAFIKTVGLTSGIIEADMETQTNRLEAENSITFGAYFDSTGLSIGTYESYFIIYSNDADKPRIDIPVVLNVFTTAPEGISYDPVSLIFGDVLAGESKVLSFTVNNDTSETVTTTGYNLEEAVFDAGNPVGVSIPAGGSSTFIVEFSPVQTGSVSTVLTLDLDIPDSVPVSVLLEGRGIISLGERIANWRNEYFEGSIGNPAQEDTVWGDRANPDGDSLPNLIEFYMGLDPKAKDDGEAWEFEERPDSVRFTYRRSKSADIAMSAIEYSFDLVSWTSENVTENVTADMGDHVVVEASVPVSNEDRVVFVRLKVMGEVE